MGMSASQARFLGLTARKSNVEYQGQQVNQQRTSLANESSGLFNQMLALQVPTPPSATDFYSMAYTFAGNAANEEFRILNWTTGTNPAEGSYNIDVKKTIIDGKTEKNLSLPIGTTFVPTQDDDGNRTYQLNIPDDDKGTINYILKKSDKDVAGRTNGDTGYVPSYSYTKNGYMYFISEEQINKVFETATELNGMQIATVIDDSVKESYYKSENTVINMTIENVTMKTDDSGRFTGMKFTDPDTGLNKEVELVIEEIHDDEGYDEAMQEYNFRKMMYDRTIQDINTRTEVIQQQDKSLELNLKQLDTEQEAIQTEIDSVKKVIEKNVQDTFKTFA